MQSKDIKLNKHKLAVKLFKITLFFSLLCLFLLASLYLYEENKVEQQLSFHTSLEWKWHSRVNRTQIYTDPMTNKSVLRKVVNGYHNKHIIYAQKNEDYSLSVRVDFISECQPNTEIETQQNYFDGTPKKLVCNEGGSALTYSARWLSSEIPRLNEDFGGFSVHENFMYWNLIKLNQEITISMAKFK